MARTTTAASDLELATRVLRTEASAILRLVDRLNAQFERAVQLILDCRGRVIVTGMGKSGLIGRKIAATLASTGTPAFYLHSAEAFHGDLGAIRADDVMVALSHSGETDEVVRLLEIVRRLGARFIVVTGSPMSTLGQSADATLDCGVDEEACPMNLAPTASTTAALALGDALAMVVLVRRGFREEDFANLHPGGQLAKRLMRVARLMHTGEQVPHVLSETSIRDVVYEISRKGLGMVCVQDGQRRLVGIITDGDLRRHMANAADILDRTAADVMTRSPITIRPSMLAVEALKLLEERKITALVVTNSARRVEGVLHLHDLWRTEMF
ncbi:MAG: KpsF/GutQ family sugar-phosphate isomerase [Vicinamibacteraceae bacterium]